MDKILNADLYGRVAVLMGGLHAEREISLMSGNAVLQALQNQGIAAEGIDVGVDFWRQMQTKKFDRAFIAMHGKDGEDGVIQGALEALAIPYTGSGVMASALAMDKPRTKWLWRGMGLSTLDFFVLDDGNVNVEEVIARLGLPLAVKPIDQGSSLGVTRINNQEEFSAAYESAADYGSPVMIEPWIDGAELTVGVLADQALPVIRIATPVGFYNYEAKYFSKETAFYCPSGLDTASEKAAQALALKAYRALGCAHWGRVDMVQDINGQLWLLEVNTIPGLTSHSLVPQACEAVGIGFEALVLRILQQTIR